MHDVALTPLLVSALIFALTYIGIFSGRVHRTIETVDLHLVAGVGGLISGVGSLSPANYSRIFPG